MNSMLQKFAELFAAFVTAFLERPPVSCCKYTLPVHVIRHHQCRLDPPGLRRKHHIRR